MKYLFYLVLLTLSLSSCFKEEDKRTPNQIEYKSIKLESDYSMQHFYNLSDTSIVSSNNWTIWDLKFYAQGDGHYVKLNDAANMKAFRTNTSEFEDVLSFDDTWISIVDDPKGDINELALNITFEENSTTDTLFTNKNVYVLMLGTNALSIDLGYKKIVVDYFYNNHYHIRFSNLDGTEEHQSIIPKDETLNFVYFSFNNAGEVVSVEPDKNTWDLLFTRSTDIAIYFTDTILDYSITGVILNPYTNKAYRVQDENFETTTSENINETNLSSQLNIIGYDWKFYDLETSRYEPRENNYYVIKDGNSIFYKMKFISFIDSLTNERGTISFEYNAIQ